MKIRSVGLRKVATSQTDKQTDKQTNSRHYVTSLVQVIEIFIGRVAELAWSKWSECSATCGMGVQARVLYCRLANVRSYRRREIQLHSPDVATECRQEDTGLTEIKHCTSATGKECPGLSSHHLHL